MKNVTLDWTDPSPTTYVNQLEIWRKLDGGTYAHIGGAQLGDETYDDDSGVIDSEKYYYEVRAYNIDRNYSLVENNITISSGFDSDYQTLLDRGTTLGYTLPSSGQQIIQNQLVLDLKSNNIWAEEDIIYVPANDGSKEFGYLNWKAPSSYELTAHNTTFWTSNVGLKTDGTTGYFNTHWDSLNDGSNYVSGDSSCTIHITTQPTVSTTIGYFYGGRLDSITSHSLLGYRSGTTTMYWKQDHTASEIEASVTVFTGTNSVHRLDTDTNKSELFLDGSSYDTDINTVITPLSGYDFYISALNNANAGANFNNVEWGWFSAGASQKTLMTTKSGLINAYMSSI